MKVVRLVIDCKVGDLQAAVRYNREMMKHTAIIYWSAADKAFIAEVPELPGCMADGRIHAAALRAVHRVAREWIETARELGRPIPKPRGRLMYA